MPPKVLDISPENGDRAAVAVAVLLLADDRLPRGQCLQPGRDEPAGQPRTCLAELADQNIRDLRFVPLA